MIFVPPEILASAARFAAGETLDRLEARALAKFFRPLGVPRCITCGGKGSGRGEDVQCHACYLKRVGERKAERLARIAAARKRPVETEAEKVVRRAATKERAREQQRKWRIEHPGYMREKRKEWNARNPEKVREWRRRSGKKSRYKRRKSTVDYLMKAQRGRCAYCREKLAPDFHVDHIIARANGGSNARSNLQLACAGCNGNKAAKDPIVFAQSLGMLV